MIELRLGVIFFDRLMQKIFHNIIIPFIIRDIRIYYKIVCFYNFEIFVNYNVSELAYSPAFFRCGFF